MSSLPVNQTPLDAEVVLHDPRYIDGTWPIPDYATEGSAAIDIRAALDEPLTISPGQTVMVSSGLAIHIDNPAFVGLLMPRSGLGSKKGIVLGNLTGVIDSDYTGVLGLPIWNRNHDDEIVIQPGDRIAQYLVVPVQRLNLKVVSAFSSETERGEGGFGSTGVQ